MRLQSLDITSSVTDSDAVFFGSKAFRRHIQTEHAMRVPRQARVDWICLAVWLSMPFVSAAFYYGIFRLWGWL